MATRDREDAKTTRWYNRYHKADHQKAHRFGGYPFGDQRCPICQLWTRVRDLKLDARRLRSRFALITERADGFQELLEEMGR